MNLNAICLSLLVLISTSSCLRSEGWTKEVMNLNISSCRDQMVMENIMSLSMLPNAIRADTQKFKLMENILKEEFLNVCECYFDYLSSQMPYSEYLKLKNNGVSDFNNVEQSGAKCAPSQSELNIKIQEALT